MGKKRKGGRLLPTSERGERFKKGVKLFRKKHAKASGRVRKGGLFVVGVGKGFGEMGRAAGKEGRARGYGKELSVKVK